MVTLFKVAVFVVFLYTTPVFAMPPASDYQPHQIQGWQVMVSPNVFNDETLSSLILAQLQTDLTRIVNTLPQSSLTSLRSTTIWVEQGMPIKKLNRTFFNGGRSITKKHGLVPESYSGVIIGNTKGYLAVAGFKQWQMLHELTHAYHQFVLRHDYQPIKNAYQQVVEQGLFTPTSDKRFKGKAYATRNQKEYLSVLTEIYFGAKPVFPRNRTELAQHDPVGYCAVVKAWGLLGQQAGADVPLSCVEGKQYNVPDDSVFSRLKVFLGLE